MQRKISKPLLISVVVLPILIIVGMTLLFIQNHQYNTRERVHSFADGRREGTAFVFDDITVDIVTRGGDSGSWMNNPVLDPQGNVLYKESVGTIYELVVINNSSDTITDWKAVVYIPEEMCVTNTWNGDYEYHQNVNSGNESVQSLDLAEYTMYVINLEHFMTSSGPMVRLYEGDYFVYYPDVVSGEMPIAPKPEDTDKESSVRIGFIMYIPEKNIDYVADFSKGEIRYHLHTSIFNSPLFWVLCVAMIIWTSCFLAMIIVKVNLRRLIEQQKRDEKIIEQTMQTIVNFIEAKDPYTKGHSMRVAQYSKLLAESMGFSEAECKSFYYIALMHDCGKLYIPDNILTKPGKLTDEEYEIMKKHTIFGEELLRDFTIIEDIGMGALCHHERYDGNGYPNGLAGEDIPVIARLICISDAFDAMNSCRCYRKNLTPDVIFNELKNNKGKQFDPVMIDHLLKLIESGVISISDNEEDEMTT
ncbi:MAG: HD-GYP domain-containing protein [Lachnospiraceae bacterium]|nr:HD-GYP domain-containing protein [Lachnospiraceae bacterium]